MIRRLNFGLLLFLICTFCIDPYHVNVDGYDNLLIVDGLITNEDKAHTVILRRSTSSIDEESPYETGAVVTISDEHDNMFLLNEVSSGVYQTDQRTFRPEVGGIYTLKINTRDGNHYVSTPCEMLPETTIDKVSFTKSKAWDRNEEFENEGISIYVSGRGAKDSYIRWMLEEDWKFRVPYPEKYTYDENKEIKFIRPENEICWKNEIPNTINIRSFRDQNNSVFENNEVQFIATELSDKVSMRYSLLVRQLTISKPEYEFWSMLAQSTEDVGGAFGSQPYSLTGNMRSVSNSSESVLGYFQCGSVTKKRIYIESSEIQDLDLPMHSSRYGCSVDTFAIDGIKWFSDYQIYEEMVLNGNRYLFEPVYPEDSDKISALLLSTPICANCTMTGNLNPPDFWED